MLVTYWSVDFTLLFEYLYFLRLIFGGQNLAANSASRIFLVDKNSLANLALAVGGGLGQVGGLFS